ncbi:pancreatic lipase-related protein 2-like [Phyllobates terribilis]|uniref:pancreatic lipase-related protein 2-like n=1 Tax=Phyllobates terribilis TaxID=111132 RepID=UPI003CCB4525
MGLQWLLVIIIVLAVRAGEVCYDRLGCFSDSPPYSFTLERPISRHPWPPEVINTRFLLFTRETPKHFQVISALNVSSVSETKFDPSRKSHFIIHGFLEAGEKAWLPDMCRTLLQVSDLNCFIVDWSGGSMAMYTQVANNVRVVGAEVAYFIDYLRDHYSHPLSSIYLIGHSLGAHVAGEAGKRCPGIARISGLDPAGPYFAHTPPEVRLDSSDAVLVDIIHTDGPPTIDKFGLGGFGMSQLVGHLDFFANGGKEQPGCAKSYLRLGDLDDVIDGIEEQMMCSHQRSVALFTQSILFPNGFVGYPGPSYRDFQEGAGFPCCNGSCAMMGYYSDSYTKNPINEVFFLNTGDVENLLCWRYRVMVNITGSMFVMGSFSVSLCGKVGCSPQYIVHSGFIHSGKSYSALIDVDMDIHPVIQVEFIWHKDAIYVIQATLGVTTIAVEHGPSRATYLFCGDEVTKEGIQQKLDPCTIF